MHKSYVKHARIILFFCCLYLFDQAPLRGQAEHGNDGSCKVLKDADGMRRLLPDCWYKKAARIKVVTFKKNLTYAYELSLDPILLSTQLEEIKNQGFSAIEIFAPLMVGPHTTAWIPKTITA